jgi:hypothetical protein
MGFLGTLESIVISIATVLITVALTVALLSSMKDFKKYAGKIADFGVTAALLLGYIGVAVMTIVKYFDTSVLTKQDACSTFSACDNNAEEYDQASKHMVQTRPFCFVIQHKDAVLPSGTPKQTWETHDSTTYPPLTGFTFSKAQTNVNFADVGNVLQQEFDATKDSTAPVQAAVFVRNNMYEVDVANYYKQSSLTDVSKDNFYFLQQANPTAVNDQGRGNGTVYMYTLPGGKPGPNESYMGYTGGTVGGIEIVPADSGTDVKDGTGVRVLDDGATASNTRFTAVPYPVSRDCEVDSSKRFVSEQSWLVNYNNRLPVVYKGNKVQEGQFNSKGIPSNDIALVDVMVLPWMVSSETNAPMKRDQGTLDGYKSALQSNGPSKQPLAGNPSLNQIVQTANSDPAITVSLALVEDFPEPYNPALSERQNFVRMQTNGSNVPQWIYGSAVVVDDNVPITAVANTFALFMVPDRRTTLPVGPDADSAVTYRAAVEKKRDLCKQQMIVYIGVYAGILALNMAMIITKVFPGPFWTPWLTIGIGCIIAIVTFVLIPSVKKLSVY